MVLTCSFAIASKINFNVQAHFNVSVTSRDLQTSRLGLARALTSCTHLWLKVLLRLTRDLTGLFVQQ